MTKTGNDNELRRLSVPQLGQADLDKAAEALRTQAEAMVSLLHNRKALGELLDEIEEAAWDGISAREQGMPLLDRIRYMRASLRHAKPLVAAAIAWNTEREGPGHRDRMSALSRAVADFQRAMGAAPLAFADAPHVWMSPGTRIRTTRNAGHPWSEADDRKAQWGEPGVVTATTWRSGRMVYVVAHDCPFGPERTVGCYDRDELEPAPSLATPPSSRWAVGTRVRTTQSAGRLWDKDRGAEWGAAGRVTASTEARGRTIAVVRHDDRGPEGHTYGWYDYDEIAPLEQAAVPDEEPKPVLSWKRGDRVQTTMSAGLRWEDAREPHWGKGGRVVSVLTMCGRQVFLVRHDEGGLGGKTPAEFYDAAELEPAR